MTARKKIRRAKRLPRGVLAVVNGNGSSIWGESKGRYEVTALEVSYINWVSYPKDNVPLHASLNLTGPTLRDVQYTDRGIERELSRCRPLMLKVAEQINTKLAAAGDDRQVNPRYLKLDWSEWGMQGDHRWNFDVSGPKP